MRTTMRRALSLAVLLAGGAVRGQEATAIEDLRQWHDRLTRPNEPASIQDGREARERIATWKLTPGRLDPQDRGRLLRLEIAAALAVGDAAAAAQALPALEREFPDTRETLRAAWLVACATGDAQRAAQILDKLRAQGAATESSVARRRARLEKIGQPAPEIEVATESGGAVALQQREGLVLVLDLWRPDDPPDERHARALVELYRAFPSAAKVQLLSVSTSAAVDAATARKSATELGYTWPQNFNAGGQGTHLTADLGVASQPWHVVIDGGGNVRAVGTASEPEFIYALRAAVVEAEGQYPPIWPKTAAGVQAQPRAGPKPAEPPVATKSEKQEKPAGKGDLPHNDEARKLLDQARVYLKTGRRTDAKKLLQEIVEKYPGTWEAKEAQERLEGL